MSTSPQSFAASADLAGKTLAACLRLWLPGQSWAQVRKLIEGDEVLFTFQTLGNASNIAIQKYLNDRKIPQLFVAGRATRFEDPVSFPWTMGFAPNLRTEIRVYARFILDNYANAKVGLLYQNDDSGKDYLTGLREALGAKANEMLTSATPYDVSDATIDSQIVRLKSAGIDVLVDMAAPKFAAQAIRKAAELDWKPVHLLGVGSSSVDAVLTPAGIENAPERQISAPPCPPGYQFRPP